MPRCRMLARWGVLALALVVVAASNRPAQAQSTGGTRTTTGAGALGGFGGTTSTATYGYTTYGMSRTPYYTATLGDTLPLVTHPNPQLQATITDMLQRSSVFTQPTPIQVRVEGQKVYLDGT